MFLFENLHEINDFFTRILRKISSQYGLTFEQSKLLINIPYNGISLSELALSLGIDNSTLTRNISKLIKFDYIRIKMSNKDKRIKIIIISKEGKKIVNNIEQAFFINTKKINKYLNKDDLQNIKNSLEKLNWTLNCLNNE